MYIIKRDGVKQDFDQKRIYNAVFKAAERTGYVNYDAHNIAEEVKFKVMNKLHGKDGWKVEDIQDFVEKALMGSKYKDIAHNFVAYRHERFRARELKEDLFKDVESLIKRNDSDILKENANRDSRIIPTIKSLVAESVGKHYAKKYILPKHVVDAHEKGEIHFHDCGELLYPMFNCMLIDLKTMLADGFAIGNANVEQPNSILTACSIAAQVVTAIGSHIYGGNTLPELDKTLAPYVKKTYDKHCKEAKEFGISDIKCYAETMTRRDTIAGIQALYYQLNTIISTQGQTVFTTLTCGLGVSWEEKLIQECMIRQQMEGLGKDKSTFVFPKLVFQVKKGVNFYESDPNYDMWKLAAECSAKRLYPDILFMDTLKEKQKTQAVPMGRQLLPM